MPVRVVHVRHMRMAVPFRLVAVQVAVLALRHGIVDVVVMAVVVAVRMLVLHRLVFMLVLVHFVQTSTPASIRAAPASVPQLSPSSPSTMASTAPMKGANAKTDPVRAAPKARCASRYRRRLSP